jgi:hypothetical protein
MAVVGTWASGMFVPTSPILINESYSGYTCTIQGCLSVAARRLDF